MNTSIALKMRAIILMMMMLMMIMMILIDFQVEIDTARGVVDASSGISRCSFLRLNHLSPTVLFSSQAFLYEPFEPACGKCAPTFSLPLKPLTFSCQAGCAKQLLLWLVRR